MSMNCPKCGGKAMCRDSRRAPDGSTSRRYSCLKAKCRWRWSTTEIIIQQGKKLRTGMNGNLTLAQKRDKTALASHLAALVKEMRGA